MFFRRLLEVPISVPKEGIYLEVGKIPVRFVIKMRRIMYWWHLVNLKNTEVLHKMYLAQKLNCSKGDWVEQLETDKKELNLNLDDEELKSFKQEQFRIMVKKRITIAAGKYLENIRNSHSKTKNLKFTEFKPANYLLSKNLSADEVRTLFKLRTRMINVKGNFETGQTNLWCRTCQLFRETQQHLLECPTLRMRTKHLFKASEFDFSMIFGTPSNQEKFTKIYHILLQAREDILTTTSD